MTDFARALKRARAAAGLSQQGMADRMLIPRRTIQDWEAEKRTPPPYVQRFVLNELESLKGAPTADEAEAVRCKNCKHYIAKNPAPADPLEPLGDCCIHGGDIWPDDFCSYWDKNIEE
jgi:transcriptional regulator with XRE-family HTH domain